MNDYIISRDIDSQNGMALVPIGSERTTELQEISQNQTTDATNNINPAATTR